MRVSWSTHRVRCSEVLTLERIGRPVQPPFSGRRRFTPQGLVPREQDVLVHEDMSSGLVAAAMRPRRIRRGMRHTRAAR